MAKYLEKAKEAKETMKKLMEQLSPECREELLESELIPRMAYEAVKAMPRIQGAVRRNYIRSVFGDDWYIRERQKEGVYDYGARKGDSFSYTCLDIAPKTDD
jgi:hypothetical protein